MMTYLSLDETNDKYETILVKSCQIDHKEADSAVKEFSIYSVRVASIPIS